MMSDEERVIRQRLRDDFPHYASRCLHVRAKSGATVPFQLNAPQLYVHRRIEAQRQRTGRVRALIPKARQWGCSTYVEGRFYWRVTHREGVRAFILTHHQDATDNLFGMADRFNQHCPELVKPHTGAANSKELLFDLLDSGYRVATAGSKAVGRSQTLQYFHGSEVAYWPNAADHIAGILQAVPDAPDTEVILESTGNGIGGVFYDLCMAAIDGSDDNELIFVPWFMHEEYQLIPPIEWKPPPAWAEYAVVHGLSREQIYWAWGKNAQLAKACGATTDEPCWLFRQEYPADINECFQSGGDDTLIRPDLVQKARKWTAPDQMHAPLVLGVDIARGGRDKTRIVDRRGRCAGHVCDVTIDSADLMEVTGRVAKEIDRLDPDAVFIDVTGLGAGVYDRLKERGYRECHAVNFGSKARDDDRYANKRAEIWGRTQEWLDDPGGADIVDSDEWQISLCAPRYSFDSNSRLILEPKEKMRERVGFSPDVGDALALTFAENVRVMDGLTRRLPNRANGGHPLLRWGRG